MAIGGVDPDVVMILQRIDMNGKVSDTFARDESSPHLIHKI